VFPNRLQRPARRGGYPAVVTTAMRRRFVRMVLSARGIQNPVLSFEEIGLDAKPALLGLAAP
jgi:flagellar biosynthesis protein FlhA